MSPSVHFESPVLKKPPSCLTEAEANQLKGSETRPLGAQLSLYEHFAERYDNHPFFLARIAALYATCNAPSMALHYYREAQTRTPAKDTALDATIMNMSKYAEQAAEDFLAKDFDNTRKGFYSAEPWKPTGTHRFPTRLPIAPEGHEEVRRQWTDLSRDGQPAPFNKYLMKIAIETNEIENAFHLTEGSTEDLLLRGLSLPEVLCFPSDSNSQDSAQTMNVLKDTLAAYNLLSQVASAEKLLLDRETICRIHACLMKTDRFKADGTSCTVAGRTRSLTRKNVLVQGSHRMIQCCPFPKVDHELDYICRMANQWISSWGRNPFATASWMHLILVRCHPFEDGNGRLSRLLASIPLMRYGYPPIAIKLEQSAAYYDAINEAYNGDHKPFVDCILKGMRETLAEVSSL